MTCDNLRCFYLHGSRTVRRGVITNSKCLSDIRRTYPKAVLDFSKNLCQIWEEEFTLDFIEYFGFLKSKFRISHVGFRISEKPF